MSAPLPSTPPRPPKDDAPDPGRARTGRILLWQSVALLGMVLSLSLVLPWKLAALVLGLVALVLGVRVWLTSRGERRAGLPRAVAAGGMALALFGTTTAALPLLAWDATVELERCTSSALTVRAQQACADAFTRAVEERTGVPQLRP